MDKFYHRNSIAKNNLPALGKSLKNSFITAFKYCSAGLLVLLLFSATGFAQTTAGLLADRLVFSSSSAGAVTYSPITTGGGATQWQSGATLNTDAVTAITITSLTNGAGFSFSYDGSSYGGINISNNGFITFGATAPAAGTYNPIASATGFAGAIAGYGFNLVASTFTGSSPAILYQVTGSSPNREFVIQFQDLARTGFTGAAADRINFQIRLVETSNVIKIVYGNWNASTTTTTASNFGQVGLRGESSSDFHTRMVGPSTATNNSTWANSGGGGDAGSTPTQAATDNTAGLNSMLYNNASFPSASSTLTYTWTPVAGSFYQSLPYTQNFDSWVNLQSLKDAPASAGVITWPSSGHLSWRNITENIFNASWNSSTGNFTSPTTQAGVGAAAFNQWNAASGTKGIMDFFVNFSAAGTKVVDFYVRNPGTTNANDALQVFLSTDGGVSFLQIGTDIAAPTPTTATAWSAKQTLTLGSSTSSTCILRFQGVSDYGSSGENLAIDELSVYVLTACTTPTTQPALLSLTSVTATSLSGSFAAASPAPSSYIVFRSTSNVAPAPVNGTTYTSAGSPYIFSGNQYTVVNTTGTGPVTFTESALTANTQYYYYAMSVNSGCAGQPYYLTTSPLTGNALTCTAAPATLTGTAASSNAATINFATVTGAASYVLQYSVAGANTWVTATPAPVTSPYTLSGLTAATSYDIRLQGPNASCGTLATTLNAFTTPCLNATLTYTQDFNSISIPSCWSQQYVTGTSALQFLASSTNPTTTPQEGADYVYWNSFSITNGNQTRLVSAPITTTGSPTVNAKFYWFHDNSAYTTAGYADEGVKLQYSLNGTTWFDVQTINRLLTGTNGWTLYDIALPPGAGNAATMYVGFLFTSRAGDNCALDNLTVYVPPACTTPTDQPTALNLTTVTATSLSGSFTAAIPAPTGGYIVLRSTSSTAPVMINGATYNVGAAYSLPGNSYTVVSKGTSTSFTESSLTANTQYYYYVVSYNGSCIGAPYFLSTSPLSANVLTCTAAPATLTGTQTGTTSASISFSTVTGASSYVLQYSVAGANAWIIASPTLVSSPYALTGLSAGTTYDIRLQGPNSNCGTTRTTSSAFTTPCASLSLPVSQGFEAGTTIPACWTQQIVSGTKNFSYGSTVTAAGTSPNPAAASGSNRLLFPSYTTNGDQTRFYSPVIVTTGTSSVDVQFQWYFSTNGGSTSYLTEGVQVQWSTNGTTWTNAGSLIRRYGATDGWQKQTITLPAGAGNQPILYVGFLLTSNAGYDSYIDDIVVKATPPCNYGGTVTAASNSICGGSGSTTLTGTDYSVAGAGLAYQWEVSSDSVSFSNLAGQTNPATASTGTITATRFYRLRVFCTALGNGYSNIIKVVVGNYSITGTTPATRCGIGTVTLGAAASPGSTISWYTVATGGTSIGTGGSFTTPTISATTNYYVGANNGASLATIGPSYSGTLDNTNSTGGHGIVISTTSPNITIISAKIPFTGKGTFTIQLQTTAGVVVSSVITDTVVGGGNVPVTVPINIAIPTPGAYRLIVAGITGTIDALGYISTAAYPYTGLSGAFSITSGYWWGNVSSDNMYLFNLVVSNVCESARSLVTATVTAPPALTISPTAATICSGSSTTINVTSPAANFITYSWLPATGVTPSGTPSGVIATLSPTSNTNYTLTATSATGCVNQVSAFITVNPAPPVTTSAAICSGGAATITSSSTCSNLAFNGNAIAGAWDAANDPVAIQPIIFLPNSTTCEFDPDGHTMNYTTINFQVSVSGSYNFLMDNNVLDGMGYIVTGAFVPGQCPGTGTWIVGDDDSGPGLMPMMDANLVAGVTYTLITTVFDYASGTSTGAYNWTITPPAGGQIATGTTGTLQWYTVPSGGTSIATGSPFNPIGVAGSGIANNTSVGSYTYYAACSNNTTCRTPATYVIGSAGQWIGGTSTDWSNPANWCGGVPTISTDGTIVSGAPNMPVLSTGVGTVRNLAVNTGATLAVTNATMQIAGTITATNNITASAGSIELAGPGPGAQSISGSSFTNRTIKNIISSNSVNVSSAAGDSIKITGALSFGNVNGKVFNSGDNVILVSNTAGTARVADITNNGVNNSNSFTGKFVVQRYIPARRAWRLMTAPVIAGAQTINQAWQEGVGGTWSLNPKPGYGTHVTGGPTRNTAQGFDQGPLNASIYGYTGSAWNYLPATTGELVTAREGWMLFVRGSRAINLPLSNTSTVADITTLRPTGAIKYGTQPTITNAGGGFTVVGNPFPSPINFKTINKTGVIGGVGGNAYYLWDPNLGGSSGVGAFVSFSWNGSTYDKSIVTGTGSSNITNTGVIPSSAAFMVNLSAGGTIAIAEKDKDTVIYTQPYVFRPAASPSSIRTTLYETETDGSKEIADGNLVTLSESFNTAVDNEDAVKVNNFRENFSIIRDGSKISIERRNLLLPKDTIFYSMWNMKQKNYELEIATTALDIPFGTVAFLEDSYRHQKTALSYADTTRIAFDITTDAASIAANRFMIVIEPSGIVPVTFTNLRAYELNHDIVVEWTVQNELNIAGYEVEKSIDGISFSSMTNTSATGGNVLYSSLDVHAVAGYNYYRIKSIDNNGRIKYSGIVKVYVGKGKPAISIYPNPVTNGTLNISFSNMSAGVMSIKLYNAIGQLVFVKQLTHAGGSSAETIRFDNTLAKGVYQLEVIGHDTGKEVFKVIVD